MRGRLLTVGALLAVAVAGAPSTAARAQTLPAVGQSVWVKVTVGTLWTSPSAPRPVDAPALRAPADIRGWLAGMSTTVRRGLVGRVETQALYGERLLVTGVRSSGWLHVVAVNQRTHRDSRGYPGWLPARQVTTMRPQPSSYIATVTHLTTWLRGASGRRIVEVSIGTRLPVLARTSTTVAVASPTHVRLYVAAADVVVRTPSTPARTRSAANVLTTARSFIGLPYLWGGRSGFAVDCSGFTQLVYKLHGVTLPRDTDDQARAGTSARLSALKPADLLFFREGSTIGHVGFFVGSGRMLHAPHTGSTVRFASMGTPALARRFL